ncbi:MAG: ABC transporter ATP-binding protein, partial [Thermomicrobiales bacterium]|nr:ABC transporter ATP-binding protein [Thermomicrobiales bacterium]
GSVTALIGPNGAGKSTLLRMAVGLAVPSAGRVRIFGRDPIGEASDLLPRIGFVDQNRPLYPRLSVLEMCGVAEHLNRVWDRSMAIARLNRLGIDLRQRSGSLSGGQQAQVALVLALAKHPELLVLDEPTAALDPLARREFLQVMMESVASDGTTVLLSSHNVPDLERVCDRLVILAKGEVRVSDEVEEFMRTHRLLVGARASEQEVGRVKHIISLSHTERQTTLLVRANGHLYDPRWDVRDVGFEEVVLAYLAAPAGVGDARQERIAS